MAGLFILIANLSIWLGGSIFNRDAFSNTAVTVIRTGPVRDAVSAAIIEDALKNVPALKDAPDVRASVGSSLKGIVSGILASNTARPVLENLADGIQRSFTAQNPRAVRLDLRSTVKQLQPFVATINREFDVNISTSELPKTIVVVKKGELPSIYGWGVPLLWFGPLLGIFGLALIVGAVWFAGPARAMVLRVNGTVLTIFALVFLGLVRFAATPLSAMAQSENARIVTLKLFDAFSAQLATQTWILAGAGAVLAAVGFLLPRFAGAPPVEEAKSEQRAA